MEFGWNVFVAAAKGNCGHSLACRPLGARILFLRRCRVVGQRLWPHGTTDHTRPGDPWSPAGNGCRCWVPKVPQRRTDLTTRFTQTQSSRLPTQSVWSRKKHETWPPYMIYVFDYFSRFHVCSSPGSTPSEITPPPSTAHFSAGCGRPDASPTSSSEPCTLSRGRPCPQPPATPSRHRPPPVCKVQIGWRKTCLLCLVLGVALCFWLHT